MPTPACVNHAYVAPAYVRTHEGTREKSHLTKRCACVILVTPANETQRHLKREQRNDHYARRRNVNYFQLALRILSIANASNLRGDRALYLGVRTVAEQLEQRNANIWADSGYDSPILR